MHFTASHDFFRVSISCIRMACVDLPIMKLPLFYLLLDVSGNNVRGRASELCDGCCNVVGYLVCHRHTGLRIHIHVLNR